MRDRGVLISFLISFVLSNFMLPLLRKYKVLKVPMK